MLLRLTVKMILSFCFIDCLLFFTRIAFKWKVFNVCQLISRGFRLTPEVVSNEVELLQRYAGGRGQSGKLLVRIQYTSNVVFKNGCRAPALRQLEGEICYLEVTTLEDTDHCITASTSGFFENKVSPTNVTGPERLCNLGCFYFTPLFQHGAKIFHSPRGFFT